MARAPALVRILLAYCLLAVIALATPFWSGCQGVLGQEPALFGEPRFDPYGGPPNAYRVRRLQVLPDSPMYAPYLAGPKESRTGIQFFYEKDDGWLWDSTVGGQIGLLRYGTYDAYTPVGIQLDLEGSAQFRSDGDALFNILSTDVRVGIPLSIGWGRQETKLAFYLLRTHPNRSFFNGRPQLPDRFFERRAFVLGHSIHPLERVRIYGEVGYAFASTMNGEWELQFGAEFAPRLPTRILGAPFAAINVYMLEGTTSSGTLTAQAGWAWRGKDARLLRFGVFYQNGFSNSFALDNPNEQQIGFGIWHDF